jgi:hypothetical protein
MFQTPSGDSLGSCHSPILQTVSGAFAPLLVASSCFLIVQAPLAQLAGHAKMKRLL